MKKNDRKYLVIFGLSLICLIASIMTYQLHQGSKLAGGVCDAFGSLSQCDKVGSSSYAYLLGIDNAIIGCIGFAVMMFLSLYVYYKPNDLYNDLIILGSIISGIAAIYFIYIQIYVLNAYCVYCIIVDTCSLVLLSIAGKDIWKLVYGKN